MSNKRALGKGLEALFGENVTVTSEPTIIAIADIVIRKGQPRKTFDEPALEELAASIKTHGVLQPLLVRPLDDGTYELIAGERRLRASKRVGLEAVPVMVKEMEDNSAREAALIENLQREDLNPVEEAMAYQEMLVNYKYTQDELANRIGKSRAYVANTCRLLNLPEEVLLMVSDGRISAGHARAILSVKDKKEQVKLANKILNTGMTVRESESHGKKSKSIITKASVEPEIFDLTEKLEDWLGTKVKIEKKRKGGKIEIAYYDNEDLTRIIEAIGIKL
ncbi:MAG: ParB/RepB/Spo0J family partition protein [Solirubrobacterales bacterium]